MHSKKIGTVLSVGLIHRFLFRVINRTGLLGLSEMRVNSFFDEADVATAFDARFPNFRKIVRVCAQAHVLIQIMR